jgi:dolichol kinase
MAFWPLFLPLDGIAIIGLMALVFLVYSRFSPIFHAMYVTDRKTYGELFFALAITVCAVFAKEPWIYTTAILFLAIADGGAALAGRLYGKSNAYFVFGFKNLKKSIAGTLAYILLAYLCLFLGLQYYEGQQISSYIYLLPLLAACIENISPYGSDDFMAPLVVVFVLNLAI